MDGRHRISRRWMLNSTILVVASICAGVINAQPVAVPVASTFENDLDGWTLVVPSEGSFYWSISEGNPPPCVFYDDIDNGTGILKAPAKFLGDWSALDGVGLLQWDHRVVTIGCNPSLVPYSARIIGPGGEAVFEQEIDSGTATNWSTIVAPISDTEWTVVAGDWSELLANVTELRISIEQVSNQGCANPPDEDVVDSIRLVGNSADLSVVKTQLRDVVARSDTLVYTLTVTNHGPDGAVGVLLEDRLPPGVTFVSATSPPGCSFVEDDGVVQFEIANMLASDIVSVEIRGLLDEVLMNNTAVVSSLTTDPVYGNNASAVLAAVSCGPTSVSNSHESSRTKLLNSHPNPFNPVTTIRFVLSEATRIDLDVYDLSGKLVCVLADDELRAEGVHLVSWAGRDRWGRQASSGVYFYRLQTSDYVETKRMTLIK